MLRPLPACSPAGADMLRGGGSAVDAAIATALCQGIHNPMASGVGGGHFMLIRWVGGRAGRQVGQALGKLLWFACQR